MQYMSTPCAQTRQQHPNLFDEHSTLSAPTANSTWTSLAAATRAAANGGGGGGGGGVEGDGEGSESQEVWGADR